MPIRILQYGFKQFHRLIFLARHASGQDRDEEFEMQTVSLSISTSKSDYSALKTTHGDAESSGAESVKTRTQWVTGIRLSACATAVVRLFNIVLGIVGASYRDKFSSVLVSMYQGNCSETKEIATGLHILINILSTTMVATSSYYCQL